MRALARLLTCLTLLTGTLLAEETLRIGEFASLTGGNASFGQSSHSGTVLAIEQLNARGGVLGKKLELLTEDTQSQAGQPAAIVKKLIFQDKVVAILGEVASSRSLEAAPICQKAGIPMISPASTNPAVTEVGDYIFRVCFIDPFQGSVMAKFALQRGWKRVALLTDVKQDYSMGLAKHFTEYFTAHGGEIVREQKYSSGDRDFRAQLTSIKSTKPDAIFVPGYYGEVALLGKQARLLGVKVPLFGGDGWIGDSLLKVAGNALDDCYISSHFSAEDQSPAVRTFVDAYRERFKSEPDDMAALGYDSAMILAAALERAGTTEGPALRDAIAATRNHAGVTGKISLDEKRNANKAAVILTIRDGAFHYLATVQP